MLVNQLHILDYFNLLFLFKNDILSDRTMG